MPQLKPGANPRAVIDEGAYRELVDGRSVTLVANNGAKVDVILADIGWDRMLQAFNDARGFLRQIVIDPEDSWDDDD